MLITLRQVVRRGVTFPRRAPSTAPSTLPAATAEVADATDDVRNVELTLRRTDLDALGRALSELLDEPVQADSPARLADALRSALRSASGRGWVEVRRSPGALRMPELWTIRIIAADRAARTMLEGLVR